MHRGGRYGLSQAAFGNISYISPFLPSLCPHFIFFSSAAFPSFLFIPLVPFLSTFPPSPSSLPSFLPFRSGPLLPPAVPSLTHLLFPRSSLVHSGFPPWIRSNTSPHREFARSWRVQASSISEDVNTRDLGKQAHIGERKEGERPAWRSHVRKSHLGSTP